ncbi:phage antirepressor [Clostridium sp. FP1]|uniref:phage antirepressor n=1 Tax=Clostridium sp. FP1 TaxID=2724076 RepID=UPI0013E98FB8|nr:phage antirepressor KilAC domain-containing protein [Clostridium sp. FP1]MBZ9633328.1 phage antirepressor KilAC domain-containing protein [Clostridium sp. FP1]
MNNLQIVDQRQVLGHDFKIYGDKANPIFKADEVASWIEHSNVSVMLNNVDDAEKKLIQIGTLNNSYSAWFLTEDGLYEVLMQSRKPIAKEFKKQVKQILKEIRKYGVYATEKVLEGILNSPEFGIRLLTELKTERERRVALEEKVKENKPLVVFANGVETSKTSILIGDLAKILKQNGLEIGQNRLFEWLRQNDYLIKGGSRKNMPTQRSMDMEIFEVKESAITNPDGSIRVTRTTKVTGKGQIYFINLLSPQNASI